MRRVAYITMMELTRWPMAIGFLVFWTLGTPVACLIEWLASGVRPTTTAYEAGRGLQAVLRLWMTTCDAAYALPTTGGQD